MIRLTLLTTILLVLTGCATLSEEECLVADWYQIGLEDGSLGRSSQWLAKHRKACAKAGVTPDLAAYEEGHEQGLMRFCNYNNGLGFGLNGAVLPQFCPAPTRAEFQLGYQHGLERRQQNQLINRIASDMDQHHSLIQQHEEDIAYLEAVLTDDQSSAEEREQALRDMRTLEHNINVLHIELNDMEQALAIEQHNMELLIQGQSYQ
ncbi:DUF2799 domain-containing protein [Halioxenophilus sp. WMMB6]|uniref:DUF2799 domain-containing protein n=1 Tax=Halioxenophilus sp. WMMB6 TaxID=3073815 RepID=UPI00295EF99B|nr:DUF2799 domain-containing protein [Halioxenophilus sp. WMMB6]